MSNEDKIPDRIIADEHFFNDLFGNEFAIDYLTKLADIHQKSKLHPWTHNIILDTSFKLLLDGTKEQRKRAGTLLACMHPEQFWKADLYGSIITKSIDLASNPPFNVVILTGSNQEINYKENKHYTSNSISDAIKIKSGDVALNFIKEMHNLVS